MKKMAMAKVLSCQKNPWTTMYAYSSVDDFAVIVWSSAADSRANGAFLRGCIVRERDFAKALQAV
jgi:hypothetical protein